MNNAPAATRRITRATVESQQRAAAGVDVVEALREQLRLVQHQKNMLERELNAAREEIARLNAENDALALTAGRRRPSSENGGNYVTHDGRTLVTQAQAADLLKVEQYTVSRWAAAGHFTLVNVPWRTKPMIDLSSVHPKEAKKRGRKK